MQLYINTYNHLTILYYNQLTNYIKARQTPLQSSISKTKNDFFAPKTKIESRGIKLQIERQGIKLNLDAYSTTPYLHSPSFYHDIACIVIGDYPYPRTNHSDPCVV